jgi:hypothetical protein
MKAFVSHAHADEHIALPFVNLLKTGIGISDVFCSSSKGAIPNGQFFVQHILSKLQAADCTISLLSPNYFRSHFCIAELGIAVAAQVNNSAKFSSYIIPPTGFGDLSGILLGIQSQHLAETTPLDELCAKLEGNLTGHTWTASRNEFLKLIKPILDRRKAEELLNKIVIHDFQMDTATVPTIAYKSKIRVQFQNNTGQSVDIGNPIWDSGATGISLQTPPQNSKVLQVETSAGWHRDAWSNEAATISVMPGAVFRLWLGLHQACSSDELRRRHEGRLLGTLQLQVKINGIDLPFEKRL